MAQPDPEPLLSVRTALVLLLAAVIALLAGVLSYLAQHEVATAVLVGGGAGGGAVALFHGLLAHDHRPHR